MGDDGAGDDKEEEVGAEAADPARKLGRGVLDEGSAKARRGAGGSDGEASDEA